MQLSIIVTTLLNTFATSPDLCAEVYADASGQPYTDAVGQTLSRYCEWTGSDAPVLDVDVCCIIKGEAANCVLPDRYGRCSSGTKRHCQHGEMTTVKRVVCYQPLPSICDYGFCEGDIANPANGPLADTLCCWGDGVCTEIENLPNSANAWMAAAILGFVYTAHSTRTAL